MIIGRKERLYADYGRIKKNGLCDGRGKRISERIRKEGRKGRRENKGD